MADTKKLTEDEITRALGDLDGWSLDQGKLFKEFRFKDFVDAFGFMTKAALAAESASHHPEWRNVYNRVKVHLTTHDAGGISRKDVDLAATMNRLAAR